MSHCREKLTPDMSHVLKAVFTGGTQAPRTGCWPQCLHVCICEGCILTLVFHQQIPLVALRSSCLWDGPPTLALSAELMALNSLSLLHCFSWGCLTHRRTHACTRMHTHTQHVRACANTHTGSTRTTRLWPATTSGMLLVDEPSVDVFILPVGVVIGHSIARLVE